MKPGSKTRIHGIFDKMTDEHFPKGAANREGPATDSMSSSGCVEPFGSSAEALSIPCSGSVSLVGDILCGCRLETCEGYMDKTKLERRNCYC
jgi:hypothetical protein